MKFEHGVYEKETIVDFGNTYEGFTIKEVIEKKIGYIVWVSQNFPEFKLDLEARMFLKEQWKNKYGWELKEGN